MLYKNVAANSSNGVIKDIDAKSGTVTGYFSIFGNVDSDGDMIMPGAFKRTLNNNYSRHKHLNQHNPLQVLSGTRKGNLTLKEDSKGLYFESKMSETSYGKDVILLYEDGALDEHSIGYNVVDQQKAKSHNELRELKLWEGSTVTWGANELATGKGLKSMTPEALQKKHDVFMKALRNGKYESEELFEVIELHLKQLEQHIQELSTLPVAGATPDPLIEKSAAPFDTASILSFIELKKQFITIN
jgi:hypothetical protein